MGVVIKPEEARNTPCRCRKIEPTGPKTPENLICWSRGVIGALSDVQDESLCVDRIIKPVSGEYTEHLQKFKELGSITDKCFEEEVENTWRCVSKEAKKRE